MARRRTHSSIDRLPAGLRDTLTRMIVDNEWPPDFPKDMVYPDIASKPNFSGNPRYSDLVTYCNYKGFGVSESAIGRFGMHLRMLAKMKNAGLIARDVMKDLNGEKASATQKAAAEMITAQAIEFISSQDSMTSKEIKEVAQAMRDCAQTAVNADKYIREQIAARVKAACESTKKKLTKAGVDRKKIQEIIDEHLGVVKS